jgi:hypothetical protein
VVIGFVFAITAAVMGLVSGLPPRQAPPHRLAADLVPGRPLGSDVDLVPGRPLGNDVDLVSGRPLGSDVDLGNVFERHLGAKFEHRPYPCRSDLFDRPILDLCPEDEVSAALVLKTPPLDRLADLLPQPPPPHSGSPANNRTKPLRRQARAVQGSNAGERSIDAIGALISSLK